MFNNIRPTWMNIAKENLREQAECALPAALEVIGERWSFLILRGVFNGLHHFEEFQATMGIARNILANRLSRMVDNGILSRETMTEDRRKVEYCLTEKGAALLPVVVALRQWGEKWESVVDSTVVLVDERNHRPICKIGIFSDDGRELALKDLCWAHAEDVRPLETLRVVREAA
jgi:DNA-binding HxlR family transcriptional regulator